MYTSVRSPAIQHVWALLMVGSAAILTGVLWHETFPQALWPAFLVAVAASAYLGGLWPGLTAMGASFAAIFALIWLLGGSIHGLGVQDVLRILSVVPVGLIVSLLVFARHRAETALHERDARLQLVSQQIPGAVWSTDTQLVVTSGFGAQATVVHGPTGQTLYEHFHTHETGFAPIAAHREALRGHSSRYDLEWGGRTFQCYVEPLRDGDRNIIGVVGVASDITDRQRVEAERERLVRELDNERALLDTIIESIPAGLCVAQAPAGRIIKSNAKVEEVLRHPMIDSPDVPSYGRWHAYHPDGRKLEPSEYPLARGLRGDAVPSAEFIYQRGDGTRGWVRVSGAPIYGRGGTVVGSVAIFYDIDQAKRAEEDLLRAKQDLEAANHAKDRFLAMLSHELRTPLAPVLALASSLSSREELPADVREAVETIQRNVELEASLIDDLLDLTRISRGKMTLNKGTVDAHELVRNAIDICRADAAHKGIEVTAELLAPRHHVRADAARLQQVFWNLIKNAIKFTGEGGKVVIRTGQIEANGQLPDSQLLVEVSDTGIGIAPEVLPRIFDAFEQGSHSITRQFGGLGLGLAISKALVDAHGGQILAHSAGDGRGATFSVELQTVDAPVLETTGRDLAQRARAAALRILLVEDHADTAKVIQKLLSAVGHRVQTAGSVAAAVRLLEEQCVDLLITDIGLPDGTGHDLMKLAAARYSLKGIALSGYGAESDVQESQSSGFAAHLTKPVPMVTLTQAIQNIAAAAPTAPAERPGELATQ
jgi:signal transduction histidine kinase/ActR/RegA family two-component response regulator